MKKLKRILSEEERKLKHLERAEKRASRDKDDKELRRLWRKESEIKKESLLEEKC
jgi:hypothetical protein